MTSKIKVASKLVADTQKPTYDEFEPFCNWQRDEDRDTLVLHLPEFKKEQLKVQISNLGVLKISGERPVNAQKRSRFHKEVKVAKECNANAIHAKYVNGLLYVVMPKTKPPGPENEEAPLAQEQAQTIKQSTDQTSPDDQANTMPTSEEKTMPTSEEKTLSSQQQNVITKPKSSSMGTKVALVITLASAIGVYIYYKYKKTISIEEVNHGYFKMFNFY